MALAALVRVTHTSLDPVVDNPGYQWVFHSDDAINFNEFGLGGGMFQKVIDFHNVIPTTGTAMMSSYLANVISRGSLATMVEVYDITAHLDGSPHGSPVSIQHLTLGSAGGTDPGMPEGCAAVVSFRANYGTDVEFGPHTRPRARDRNRFYFGPLAKTTTQADGTTKRIRFTNAFIADALLATKALAQPNTAGGVTWQMRVWSRVANGLKVPTTIWMDDRIDYQRRRVDPNPASKQTLTV